MVMCSRDKLWYDIMKERGHTPIMDGKDSLEYFVYENGFHNGPGCSSCGWSVCWHCERDPKKAVPLTCNKSR